MEVSFKAAKKDLMKVLTVVKNRNKNIIKNGLLRISILPDAVEFFNHGVSAKIPAETEGLADVSMPDYWIYEYIKTSKQAFIEFKITSGKLVCNSTHFSSPTIKVEAFMSTKESLIPVNADDFTILKFGYEKDKKWLEERDLYVTYNHTHSKLESNLKKAAEILSIYRITAGDLIELLEKKIVDSIN